jgi:PAS domain S-box-containing protein
MADPCDDHFFRDMCIHAGLALIATDEQLRIRFWNPAAGRMLGGSAEAMTGQAIWSIVPAERRELAERLCKRALSHGETSELDFQYRDPAGQPMFLAVTISPIIDSTQRRTGISVYVRDVTRRMTLERAMAESQKMSALGLMAGQVAHHFNNVLGGIITSLDFAQASDDPDVLRRAMRTTLSALTRANTLTQGLLAFAEGDRSASSLGNLGNMVRQYAAELESRLAAQNIRLEIDVEVFEALLPTRQVLTVLDNLVANAREAMPTGGMLRIELQLVPSEAKAILRVADTGAGIAPENLPRVFEPFFTTKGIGDPGCSPHAGLGLAVVHGIVNQMGGSVSVASAREAGTVCSVTLPLTR